MASGVAASSAARKALPVPDVDLGQGQDLVARTLEVSHQPWPHKSSATGDQNAHARNHCRPDFRPGKLLSGAPPAATPLGRGPDPPPRPESPPPGYCNSSS